MWRITKLKKGCRSMVIYITHLPRKTRSLETLLLRGWLRKYFKHFVKFSVPQETANRKSNFNTESQKYMLASILSSDF